MANSQAIIFGCCSQNPFYPSLVVENVYNSFVGVSKFDKGTPQLHKWNILRKQGVETFGEETHTFDKNMFHLFVHLDPRLKNDGGCCGGVFVIANVFSNPNIKLIKDCILKILNATIFVIDAIVTKKKILKPYAIATIC